MSRIKQPTPQASARVAAYPEFADAPDQRPPEFSFRYVQSQSPYCLSYCDKAEKAALVDTLRGLSHLTWAEIRQIHRHGMGSEKISRDAIRATIPAHITPDVDLLAFRFSGKKPMVGYRREATFFILWLDRDFTLYKHG